MDALLLKLHFFDQVADIRAPIRLLKSACAKIIANDNLAEMIKTLVEAKNVMNEAYAMPVKSIALDSLIPLARKKSTDRLTSLTDIIVEQDMMKDNGGTRISDFAASLTDVVEAKKTNVQDIAKESVYLKDQVKRLRDLISVEKSLDGPPDGSSIAFIEKCSQFADEAEKTLLEVEAELVNAEQEASTLRMHFAEDPETQTSKIFEIILAFCSLVEEAKERWARKDCAKKKEARKAAANLPAGSFTRNLAKNIPDPTEPTSTSISRSRSRSHGSNPCPVPRPFGGPDMVISRQNDCRDACLAAIRALRGTD